VKCERQAAITAATPPRTHTLGQPINQRARLTYRHKTIAVLKNTIQSCHAPFDDPPNDW
jgi:hypothetical protein